MPSFKVTACTAEHIGDRAEQQDSVALLTSPRHPNSLLAVVSDGMGGRTGGRMPSDQVIATVTHLFRETSEAEAGGLDGLLRMMANEAHTVIHTFRYTLSARMSNKGPTSSANLIQRNTY